MKRSSYILSMAVCFVLITSSLSCKKEKTEEENTCKTCKAFGIDGVVGEAKVCTPAEEEKFRSDYAGKEITCR